MSLRMRGRMSVVERRCRSRIAVAAFSCRERLEIEGRKKGRTWFSTDEGRPPDTVRRSGRRPTKDEGGRCATGHGRQVIFASELHEGEGEGERRRLLERMKIRAAIPYVNLSSYDQENRGRTNSIRGWSGSPRKWTGLAKNQYRVCRSGSGRAESRGLGWASLGPMLSMSNLDSLSGWAKLVGPIHIFMGQTGIMVGCAFANKDLTESSWAFVGQTSSVWIFDSIIEIEPLFFR